MARIEIEVTSTKRSVTEAVALTRRRLYWLRTVLGTSYHIYLLVPGAYLGWLGLRGLISYTSRPTRNWPSALMCTLLAMIPVVLAVIIGRDIRDEVRARRAKHGPVTFMFTEEGISGVDVQGFAFTDMWVRYAGFHVGQYVIVCPKVDSRVHLRIPTEGLPDSERQEVCSLLSRHISELSKEDLSVWARSG